MTEGDPAYLTFIQLVKVEKKLKIVPVVPEKIATRCDVVKAFHEDMPKNIKAVLLDYKDIFPTDLPQGFPLVQIGHEFRIGLEDKTPPIHRPIYQLNPVDLEEARKQIQFMVKHGCIRPLISPYGSPILFAPKDGGLLFCIDYHRLNEKTIKNKYPLPLRKELFNC